jgi:ubiquinone/menaquinone biosynthesis C-methylase UbiE
MVANHLLPPSAVGDLASTDGRSFLETTADWVADLLDAADLERGDRVLDLTDGTGAVARAIRDRVQPGGTTSLVDAASLRGRSARLPYPDASFDAVLSLHTLEAFADRGRPLAELRRVLSAGGRLALAVWGPIAENPAFAALADSLRHRGGVRAEAAVHWLSSLSQPDDLRALLGAAGFDHFSASRRRTVAMVTSAEELLWWLLGMFPIGEAVRTLPAEERERIASDLERVLEQDAHVVAFTTDVHAACVPDQGERGSGSGTG